MEEKKSVCNVKNFLTFRRIAYSSYRLNRMKKKPQKNS